MKFKIIDDITYVFKILISFEKFLTNFCNIQTKSLRAFLVFFIHGWLRYVLMYWHSLPYSQCPWSDGFKLYRICVLCMRMCVACCVCMCVMGVLYGVCVMCMLYVCLVWCVCPTCCVCIVWCVYSVCYVCACVCVVWCVCMCVLYAVCAYCVVCVCAACYVCMCIMWYVWCVWCLCYMCVLCVCMYMCCMVCVYMCVACCVCVVCAEEDITCSALWLYLILLRKSLSEEQSANSNDSPVSDPSLWPCSAF